MIFRDNIQPMLRDKNVLLLFSSITTGKTVNRALECVQYYGGKVVGICTIFSAVEKTHGFAVASIFSKADLPDYQTYPVQECPECAKQRKIDAIVNSFGYSKMG